MAGDTLALVAGKEAVCSDTATLDFVEAGKSHWQFAFGVSRRPRLDFVRVEADNNAGVEVDRVEADNNADVEVDRSGSFLLETACSSVIIFLLRSFFLPLFFRKAALENVYSGDAGFVEAGVIVAIALLVNAIELFVFPQDNIQGSSFQHSLALLVFSTLLLSRLV